MALQVGFRKALVFNSPATGVLTNVGDGDGGYLLLEVTNAGASTANITLNQFPNGGYQGVTIPVAANSTRQIPMQTYNFQVDSAVTIVAYGM